MQDWVKKQDGEKPRLEFAGAIYHVISRGNYRKELFEEGADRAFERTLFEACGKCGWRLHAYVIMSNHYHLALETPEANLVEGMRWLQGTFGIRFNAFRRKRGRWIAEHLRLSHPTRVSKFGQRNAQIM